MGSKCSISLINAKAVILHQYLSRRGGEETLVGIQFGLGAFNQTISCFIFHETNLSPWELYAYVGHTHACIWRGLKQNAVKKKNLMLPPRSRRSFWMLQPRACVAYVQTDNLVFPGSCAAAVMHVGRRADTAVDSPKHRWTRAGGLEEPLDSTPFTLHNWMQRGALQHRGLDGTGRKMDEVSNTFTTAALLHADVVSKREYHTAHVAHTPTRWIAQLSHSCGEPNTDCNIFFMKDAHFPLSGNLARLLKSTGTYGQYFRIALGFGV